MCPRCPHCGRDAPIVYRGPLAFCTACGGTRPPLSGPSVNLAGKPAKVGGAVTKLLGWMVLLGGLSTALGVGLVLYVLATASVALTVALPVALAALIAGIAIVQGGRRLGRSGADTERTTRDQALLELAAHRGGITATDAARALDVSVAEADAMLTALAKNEPERVLVDIDDQGAVWFRAARIVNEPPRARSRVAQHPEPGQGEADEVQTEQNAEHAPLRR